MTKHYNKAEFTALRRMLRNNLSKAEAVVWKHLSRKQMSGYKFRRQYGVDRYVIDFYCPELKLAVEIDGDTHVRPHEVEYDKERQMYLETFGIQLMRFTNTDVYEKLDGVLEAISEKAEQMEKTKTSIQSS